MLKPRCRLGQIPITRAQIQNNGVRLIAQLESHNISCWPVISGKGADRNQKRQPTADSLCLNGRPHPSMVCIAEQGYMVI